MKKQQSRLDWFSFYPSDFVNAPDVLLMSSAARGAYITMLCHCWLNVENGCSIRSDEEYLLKITNCSRKEWKKISAEVLPKFSEVPPELGQSSSGVRLTNDRLQRELGQIRTTAVTNTLAASASHEPNPICNQQKKVATAERPQSDSTALALPKDNNTVQNNTIENIKEGAGHVLDSLQADSRPTEYGVDTNGRKKGQPGYYEQGQYPGTDPKKIFKHMQAKWCDVKGEGAYAKYPNKYPQPWLDLCDAKSSDLIVPAFELWCHKEGKHMNTAWPVSEFLKNVDDYLAIVKPLIDTKPKVSAAEVRVATEQAYAIREAVWAATPAEDEPGADAFLTEEKSE